MLASARPNVRRTPHQHLHSPTSSINNQAPKAIQRIVLTATTIITLCLVYIAIVKNAIQSNAGQVSTRVLSARVSLNTTAPVHNTTMCSAKNNTDNAVHSLCNEMDMNASNTTHCCSTLFNSVPKVALLFLTRGPMPHEWLWRTWLTQAQHLIPPHPLDTHHPLCNASHTTSALLSQCITHTTTTALHQQHLFTLYVHAPPTWPGYSPDSLFHGRLITQRIDTQWGTFDLVQAARLLLAAALEQHSNQRFVLLSESCVPLYAPQVVYLQLMEEDKSRVDACGTMGVDRRRYRNMMSESQIPEQHWRKSWQWWMLIRSHAQLVVEDHQVAEDFRRYCTSVNETHVCYSDEHYVPTLLAMHGLDNTTSCNGGPTFVQFWEGDPHPQTFRGDNVSSLSVRVWRQPHKGCHATYANTIQQAHRALMSLNNVTAAHLCSHTTTNAISQDAQNSQDVQNSHLSIAADGFLQEALDAAGMGTHQYQPMPVDCPLFARMSDDDLKTQYTCYSWCVS